MDHANTTNGDNPIQAQDNSTIIDGEGKKRKKKKRKAKKMKRKERAEEEKVEDRDASESPSAINRLSDNSFLLLISHRFVVSVWLQSNH